ncbi:hypothetical protein FA95DRAFT_1285056 [Auriscalpium vulgare]|uniref:Uncharacterized protein n=1 Tax=Auriscalpium vulgare TaxID=40419 RepID=A0ACB8RSJ1_9AGAM|nr:hypothetical protein FA95DRAFT_1285056 [Auriscalpium vulgare]
MTDVGTEFFEDVWGCLVHGWEVGCAQSSVSATRPRHGPGRMVRAARGHGMFGPLALLSLVQPPPRYDPGPPTSPSHLRQESAVLRQTHIRCKPCHPSAVARPTPSSLYAFRERSANCSQISLLRASESGPKGWAFSPYDLQLGSPDSVQLDGLLLPDRWWTEKGDIRDAFVAPPTDSEDPVVVLGRQDRASRPSTRKRDFDAAGHSTDPPPAKRPNSHNVSSQTSSQQVLATKSADAWRNFRESGIPYDFEDADLRRTVLLAKKPTTSKTKSIATPAGPRTTEEPARQAVSLFDASTTPFVVSRPGSDPVNCKRNQDDGKLDDIYHREAIVRAKLPSTSSSQGIPLPAGPRTTEEPARQASNQDDGKPNNMRRREAIVRAKLPSTSSTESSPLPSDLRTAERPAQQPLPPVEAPPVQTDPEAYALSPAAEKWVDDRIDAKLKDMRGEVRREVVSAMRETLLKALTGMIDRAFMNM